MASTKHQELIQTAATFAEVVKDFNGDPAVQMKLLKQVDKLRILLETPMDTIFKQCENSHVTAAMHLLVEMDALEKMPREGSITSADLAAVVGIDESAIARALRLIVMAGIGEETSPNSFAHNDKSRAYLKENAVEFFRMSIEHTRAFLKYPEYFRAHTQSDLYDLTKSPYAWYLGLEGMTYYEAISHDPARLNTFNRTMTQMESSVPILGMFPFASLKEEVEAEPERPCIVDIGGGRGHVLRTIMNEVPFGGKMILQDRPDVLDSLPQEEIPGVEKMAHDFFKEQPVKNAHVYLLRRIAHDFYEPVCIEILKNIASALTPKSRLIIADMVLPEKTELGGELTSYWMDYSMMMLNGKEKSAKEFHEIVGAAGMEIVKFWMYPFGTQAQIECRLKRA